MNKLDVHTSEEQILNNILFGYGLDHEFAVYEEIIEECGLNLENKSLLTPELLESHYDDILMKDPFDQDNPEYFKLLYPVVLGALILKIGARLPIDLQKKIIDIDIWDIELKQRWKRPNDHHLENEINALTEFQEMIRNHESGKITEINPYNFLYSRISEENEFYLRFFNTTFFKPLTKEDLEEKLDEIINDALVFDDYINDDTPLTNEQIDEIKRIIKDSKGKSTPGYFIILGVHVLKTGASIPENLKKRIIETAESQKQVLFTKADVLKKRKQLIIEFKILISGYKNVF